MSDPNKNTELGMIIFDA